MLPYLPDPLADRRLAHGLRLHRRRGLPPAGALHRRLARAGAVPPALVGGRARRRPSTNGVLEVRLPKAEVVWARLASVFPDGRLEDLAVWQWIPAGRPHAALEKAAAEGRHWMLTPFRRVTFTHAVQQPLARAGHDGRRRRRARWATRSRRSAGRSRTTRRAPAGWTSSASGPRTRPDHRRRAADARLRHRGPLPRAGVRLRDPPIRGQRGGRPARRPPRVRRHQVPAHPLPQRRHDPLPRVPAAAAHRAAREHPARRRDGRTPAATRKRRSSTTSSAPPGRPRPRCSTSCRRSAGSPRTTGPCAGTCAAARRCGSGWAARGSPPAMASSSGVILEPGIRLPRGWHRVQDGGRWASATCASAGRHAVDPPPAASPPLSRPPDRRSAGSSSTRSGSAGRRSRAPAGRGGVDPRPRLLRRRPRRPTGCCGRT